MRDQSISSQQSLTHEEVYLLNSLSPNFAASVLIVSTVRSGISCPSNTFLNVQVPDRPARPDLRVCDALKVGDWDLAYFEMHGSRLRRQLLEKRSELGQERKNITRMPLVAYRANFERLDAGHGAVCDSFAHENTGCTQSILDTGQHKITRGRLKLNKIPSDIRLAS